MKCCILLFTRYPIPGKTKTRLIPALGEEGAAHLHRKLTSRIFSQAGLLYKQYNIPTTVYYTGGSEQEMEEWLGRARYQKQCHGDLGLKMASAFRETFAWGIDAAVLIGSDIPHLTVKILNEAAKMLQCADVVIGPSRDGGYYLIGCRARSGDQLLDLLFADMVWSTSGVFETTLRRLHDNGYSTRIIEKLADIDTPDDLEIKEVRDLL